ncbi:A disintegrin and metalloproteinase with thrombospondin motifs like [Haemaphysalis longicornis]
MKVAVVKDIGGAYMGSNNMAHEMGHLLGSPHDGPDNWRFPDCAEDGGIMSPNLEAKAAHSFSTCSEDSIANFLERMSDYDYEKCIAVKQPNKDFLSVQMHIVPPTLTAEEYCEATQGSLHYYSDFAGCIITCYHGGFWSGWPRQVYPAPYGMRCGEGMMCLYGECVSCDQYTPSWYDC